MVGCKALATIARAELDGTVPQFHIVVLQNFLLQQNYLVEEIDDYRLILCPYILSIWMFMSTRYTC